MPNNPTGQERLRAAGARMLPPTPTSPDTPESERLVFRRLAEDCPSDWTIIHSLGIARHERKRWAEADFVVITSQGILVIEVKGGQIARRDGVWFTGEKKLEEPPLQQAAGAAAALKNHLRDQGLARRAVVEGAALFTDVHFNATGSDIDPQRIGDVGAITGRLDQWAQQTLRHCRAQAEQQGRGAEYPGLSEAEREAIVSALAGDFDLRPAPGSSLARARGEMIRLTNEQKSALEIALDNERSIITGGAGTGKTMLALEHAAHAAADGKKVLLVVYNKALALELRSSTAFTPNLEVVHFHGLADDLIGDGKAAKSSEDSDYFREDLPLAAIEALEAMDDPPLYDLLIVDEAQDLLFEMSLDLLDCMLAGGLASGSWCFFHDPKQDIFRSETPAALARLESAHPARKVLRLNCRNTREIAELTALCSGREPEPTLPLAGPQIEVIDFDEYEDLKKAAGRVLTRWIKEEGVPAGEIVVLSKHKRPRSAFSDGMPAGVPAPLEDIAKGEEPQNPNAVRFSTIASFKGLEAEAVLLLNAGNFDDENNRDLLYVGMSRARLLLAVGVPERQRARFDELVEG